MGDILRFDSRGRITVPKALRRGLGEEFVAIRTPTGIELFPVKSHLHIPVPASEISGEDAAMREVGR